MATKAPKKVAPAKPVLSPGADNMLAALAQGHAANAKRLDAHDGRLDGHDGVLDGHKAQLGEHHDRITALEKAAGSAGDGAGSDTSSGGS